MSALRTYLWTALVALVGCGSPLVGLECQDGLERCGNACYDLSNDQLHCGGCNISCTAAQHCASAVCVAGPAPDAGDGGGLDAGLDAGEGGLDATVQPDGRIVDQDGQTLTPDGRVVLDDGAILGPDGTIVVDDASLGDGGDPDATLQPPVLCTGPGSPLDCVCGIGLQKCGDICVDTSSDHEHCGNTPACGVACAADEVCTLGMCADICMLPTVFCNGQCVDRDTDDANCGSCGFACAATAQCINGGCVGKVTGHVIAIGHDMTGILRPAIQRVVGNSVFLAARATVRVLVYDAATSIASRAGVTTAIAAAAASIGRQYNLSVALPETVTTQLATADVFVIDPQQGATDNELGTIGNSWSAALSDFLFRGGVVVMFDGGPDVGDMNLGTWQLLHAATDTQAQPPAPIFQATGSTFLSQRLLTNVRPGDAIGINVPTPYQSAGQTVGFTLDPPLMLTNPHNIVVGDVAPPYSVTDPFPVVVHVVFEM